MQVEIQPTFAHWRESARSLLAAGHEPDAVEWKVQHADAVERGLFDSETSVKLPQVANTAVHVPKEFLQLARAVAAHSDERRWNLLYRLLWRLSHENRQLLQIATDDDVLRARRWEKQVGRDIHKMHAFVRFQKFKGLDGTDEYVAWHVPDHHIVRMATPFFARRFAAMRWTILTPDESATWDGETLRFTAGCPQEMAPKIDDELEDLWRTYYGAIFNPARIKIGMMKREMPVRHWRTLPETSMIDELLADAPRRVEAMLAEQPGSAAPFVPASVSLPELALAAKNCGGCGLCKAASQTVFGEGPATARVVVVGEQPGDSEDLAGRPFVGPAGQLLDEALAAAGLDRARLYLTNAVKHFKYEQQGKLRLHKRPDSREVAACRPWLEAELAHIQPSILICLGVTAAQSILGRAIRLGDERGRWLRTAYSEHTLVTTHPSAILRTPEGPEREAAFARFVEDLRLVTSLPP